MLKERYLRMPAILTRIDGVLQRITASAYSNVNLVSNEVLSRNPSSSALLHNVLWESRLPAPGAFDLLGRVATYYVKSLIHFALYAVTWATQRVRADRRMPALDEPVHVIDTFVLQEGVRREGRYEDRFFPGLAEVLRRHHKRTVILPRFYGAHNRPVQVARVMRILRGSGETFVTEFDLLHVSDLARTLLFILRYPIDVLRLARRLRGSGDEVVEHVRAELQATVPHVTFSSHVRYLVGRRLGVRARAPLTVISWFENQVIDKNLYRGVRETAPGAVIYGCQPFLFSPPFINTYVADAETEWGVTPDVVLVGGPAYQRESRTVPHRPGPSFRYAWLWPSSIDWSRKREAVVFLTYSDRLSEDIVAVAGAAASLREEAIEVKSHPSFAGRRLPTLPGAWRYSERTTAELLTAASILITSQSGTAVEAAVLGCSVIVIAGQSTFTLNPMPEEGRGEIWELAFDGEDVDAAIRRLRDFRARHPERIRALATWYRDAFFVQPTESSIFDAFGL